MVHKLADNWRCHLIPRAGDLPADGQMDFRGMLATGELQDGRHYLQTGGFRTLKGQATGINPIVLTLTEFNDRNIAIVTYTGELVFEHPDGGPRMVLVGLRHFLSATPGAADQQDTVWVLTKP